ncbi:MAG: O-antigen ligase family protein [bacterium]
MKDYLNTIKLSKELKVAVAIVAFVGLFCGVNYFFGFILPLYLITILVATVLAFKYPQAGLYAIIFLTFIFERFFTLVPIVLGKSEYKLYPIDVIFAAVLFGIIFQIILGKIQFKLAKIDWLLVVFGVFSLVYFFVSIVFANGEIQLAFSSAKNYAFYSLFYFATYLLIDNRQHMKELLVVLFSSAIGILWFVFYGILVRHGLWSDFTPLSTDGIRTLAFTHGYYLCMAIIAGLVYVAYKSDLVSKLLLIVMPLWLIGIVGSMMRHLWISIFVAIIFVIILFARNARKRLRTHAKNYSIVVLMFLVLVFYGATLFPRSSAYNAISNGFGMITNRITSVTNTTGDESIVWRSAVWQQAGKEYLQNPLLGIGFGKKVSVEIGSYHDFVEVRNMHNSFLVVLVQMGILGIGLFGLFVGKLGWKVFVAKIDDEDFQIAAKISLGILVFQLTAFMFQPYLEANLLGIFFWINLGILRRICENVTE